MKVLACTVETIPCPPENEVWIDFSTAIDFAALGITAETTTYALTFGFAAVFGFFVLGYVLGIAKGLIKKL
ncbi:hypothetical protein [Comamonas aquatica]|uniref:Uncharacterized protein n=1 Tax=Comamonas aquatica TaxID=225991 RepID=A0AA42L3H1_9BURK|nr:hypothetical protein [Comamonas aquatica]MDH0364518.1 hypothetical protein [Comamonas aquatica]